MHPYSTCIELHVVWLDTDLSSREQRKAQLVEHVSCTTYLLRWKSNWDDLLTISKFLIVYPTPQNCISHKHCLNHTSWLHQSQALSQSHLKITSIASITPHECISHKHCLNHTSWLHQSQALSQSHLLTAFDKHCLNHTSWLHQSQALSQSHLMSASVTSIVSITPHDCINHKHCLNHTSWLH